MVRTQHSKTLGNDHSTWDPQRNSLPLSQISQRHTPMYPAPVATDNSLSYLQIEGKQRSSSMPRYQQQPAEIAPELSISRCKTYPRTPQCIPRNLEETGRGEPSYSRRTLKELSCRSNTEGEVVVAQRQITGRRRSSFSSRQIKRAQKKLREEELKRQISNYTYESSESESESPESLDTKPKKLSIGDQCSKWLSVGYPDEIWSDDGEEKSLRFRSVTTGGKGRNDSVVVLDSEEYLFQGAEEMTVRLDELQKFRSELCQNKA